MNKSQDIDRLLCRAHQLCWDIGRHDVGSRVIAALNTLRGFVVKPVLDTRDNAQRDYDEEAHTHGVSVAELLD